MKNRLFAIATCFFAALAMLAIAQPSEAQSVRHSARAKQQRQSKQRTNNRRQDNRQDKRHDNRRDDRHDDRRDDRHDDRRDDRRDAHRYGRHDRYDRWDDWVDHRRRVAGARLVLGMIFRSLPPQHTVIHVGPHRYYYHDHTYFIRVVDMGVVSYRIVAPPLGARVTVLPMGHTTIVVGGSRYYLHDNVYYSRRGNEYIVVRP